MSAADEAVALALAVRRGQIKLGSLTQEQQLNVRRVLAHASDVQLAAIARREERPRHRAYGRT